MDSLDKAMQDFLDSPFLQLSDEKGIMDSEDVFLVCQYYYHYLLSGGKSFTDSRDLESFLTEVLGEFTEENMMSLIEELFTLEHLYYFVYRRKIITEKAFLTAIEVIHAKTEQIMNEFTNMDDDYDMATITNAFNHLFLSEELDNQQKPHKNNVIPMNGKRMPTSVLQFRIDVTGFKPPIWRRVLVPNYLTFHQFHDVIQGLFEWENIHSYEFLMENTLLIDPLSPNHDLLDHSVDVYEEQLSDWFHQIGDRCTYTYDFDDDWFHHIKLERIFQLGSPEYNQGQHVCCIKLKGDAPAEGSRLEERFVPSDLAIVNRRLQQLDKDWC